MESEWPLRFGRRLAGEFLSAAPYGGFSFGAEGGIRVKPVSVRQFQKSPCQLVSMSIHRFRQPARSKERGNSFAGGQGADLHTP